MADDRRHPTLPTQQQQQEKEGGEEGEGVYGPGRYVIAGIEGCGCADKGACMAVSVQFAICLCQLIT